MINLKQNLLSLGFFVDNKYLDFYCTLIQENLTTPETKGLTEKHHIIQRKIYTILNKDINNDVSNLVNLTHFDHCKAHYYLCLCTKGKLKYSNEYAFIKMVKIETRFKDFNFEEFCKNADKYNEIYNSFVCHQSELNAECCRKRGGGTIAGRHCYTNGEKIIFADDCPEGYWPAHTNNKKPTIETKQKMSESAKIRGQDVEYRQRQSNSLKEYYKTHCGSAVGKIWINNGINEKYISLDKTIPSGWTVGRKKLSKETKQKISAAQRGKKIGKRLIEKKVWVHFNTEEKLVPTSEVEKYINLNYSLGRSKK